MINIAHKKSQPEIKLTATKPAHNVIYYGWKTDQDVYIVGILKTAQVHGEKFALVEIMKQNKIEMN